MTNFLHSLESKKSKIKTFNSIIKNETGVNPVKGERYSIVMWFESNPMLFDQEVINDLQVLHYLNLFNMKD